MQNYLQFINHASILVSNGNKTILTDPWYRGGVFDDGWNLLYENEEDEIRQILSNVDFIWISHEHPDHFSIRFFIDYAELIKKKDIKFLFQKTKDQRVIKFLKSKNFTIIELDNEQNFQIDKDFELKIQNSDFYDSALIIKIREKKIFNLNDCPINSKKDLLRFKKLYGNCDFLITQFSYAAWKGGKKNKEWRRTAAREKLNTLISQSNTFKPKYLIPFASFIYFSDNYNFYLNDSMNTPEKVLSIKDKIDSKIIFLKPYEKISLDSNELKDTGYKFWNDKFNSISSIKPQNVDEDRKYNFAILSDKFRRFRSNLFEKNSYFFCKILSKINFLQIFKTIVISLKDINEIVEIDLVNGKFQLSKKKPDVEMNSKSLYLIFTQGYGYDTLTVNGCFEELNNNGFVKMTQSLALGNLNNMGVFLNFSIIFNLKVILLFLKKIFQLKKKINYKYISSLE